MADQQIVGIPEFIPEGSGKKRETKKITRNIAFAIIVSAITVAAVSTVTIVGLRHTATPSTVVHHETDTFTEAEMPSEAQTERQNDITTVSQQEPATEEETSEQQTTIRTTALETLAASTTVNSTVTTSRPTNTTVRTTTTTRPLTTTMRQTTTTAATVPVNGVSIDQWYLTSIRDGDSGTLTATVSPYNADNTEVTWKSGNSVVVAIKSNGEWKAMNRGRATITVTTKDGGYTDSIVITVN